MALKAQAQFTNPYEAAYQRYSSSPFFDSSDWKYVASGSDSSNLDMYIRALDLLEKRDKRVFDKTYGTEFENSETRLAAIYNEAFASHTANDDRYQIDVYQYDDAGNMLYDETGNPKVQKKTVSEYQYNKMIIRQQNDERRLAHLRQLAEEAKDPTAWADAMGILVDVAYDGILEFFNKTLSLGKTLIDMAVTDKTFKDDWFTQWENNYKPILDRIKVNGVTASEAIMDIESQYSHMRDLDGNLTTFGKYASGVATTIGEVTAATITGGFAAMPLGGAAAGTGTAAKVAGAAVSAIRTGAYYAPLAAYGMGESYKEITAKGQSVATSKMISNQLWKTGIEIGIESALGKVFGATGLDKMLFGRAGKVAKKAGKVGTLRGVAHFAGEALQEGAEEFLQEFSGFLVDKAYSNLVNEAFEPEFSVQNLIDAAIIGSLVSGVHSSFSIVSTKGKTLADADGNARKLGKIASAYYNISMPTFLQNLEDAQKSLDDMIAQIPTQQKLQALTKRKSEIETEIKSVNEQLASFTNKNALLNIGKLTQEVASEVGKGFSLNQSLELVKNSEQNVLPETLIQRRDALQRSLQSVDSDIANTKAIKQSVDEKVGMDNTAASYFAEAFRSIYAAARAVQSFAGVIGNERMTRASQILGRIEQMGNDGKFNEAEAVKARNEMIKELQLSGFSTDKGLVRRIKEAKMTKLDQLVTKEDLGDDKVKWANFIKMVLEQTEAETVGITDGTNAIKDGKLVLVPEGELKLGAEQVTQDLAEQQLIENLVDGKYAGAPIERVLDLYKKLSGNNDATEYDAARHLLFDDRLALFKVLLFGDKKDIPLADNNMYRFLVALYEDYNLFLPKTILDEVTKTKLDNIKNKMTNAFIGYLKLQPYADYNVDFLNDAQKQAIKQHTESMAVFNRLVEGKATSSDIAFIYKKINALQADKATKEGLYKMINSKEPTTIRSALFNIDTRYRIAFYGTNNGETYMPVNSIRNRAFNMFLYNNNITIGNIVAEASNMKTMDEVKNYIHNLNTALNSFTSKRYSLRLRKAKTVNTESGQFKLNSDYRIEIIDNDSVLKTKDLSKETLKAVATQKEKTVVYRGSKLTNVIASLVKDKRQAAYYSIDDLVVKPELLSDELQKEIREMYGELTSDSTYQYLRENLPKAVSGLTISLMADGTIGFVNVEGISELLIDDVSQFAITNGIKLEKFLKNPDRVPFLKDCVIELTTGNSDFNIRKLPNGKVQGVIKINANIKNDMAKLKTALAHEVQHAIQFANRLNTGNDGNIYSKLSKKDQESITKELTAQFPKVFEGAKAEDIPNLVNAVLYYASGEIAAHGAESSGVINFVPILIQDKDNTTTVTLPNGSNYSFKSDNAKNLMEVEAPLTDQQISLIEQVKVGKIATAEISDFVWTTYEIDPSIEKDLPKSLVQMVLEAYHTLFKEDGDIEFVSDSDMRKRTQRDMAQAGAYSDKGKLILLNSEVLERRIRNNDYNQTCKTVLHEMLHAVTVNALRNTAGVIGETALKEYLDYGKESSVIQHLSDGQRAALALIKIHASIKQKLDIDRAFLERLGRSTSTAEPYGLTNYEEFVAELANPIFRRYLHKETLWERIINAISKLLRAFINKESTALEAADKALYNLLSFQIESGKTSVDNIEVSDETYFKAIEENDTSTLTKLVKAAAMRAGFYSAELYHGTTRFGFTKPDVSNSQDERSFFVTDNLLLASRFAANFFDEVDKRVISTRGESKENIVNDLMEFFVRHGVSNGIEQNYDGGLREFVSNVFDDAVMDYRMGGIYFEFPVFKSEINDETGEIVKDYGFEDHKTHEEIWRLEEEFIEKLKESVEKFSDSYGVYSFYANLNNSVVIDALGNFWNHIPYGSDFANTYEIVNREFDKGADVVIFDQIVDVDLRAIDANDPETYSKYLSKVYVFKDPAHQLRSSDLVTYDDDGNIIPLSQRFNSAQDDFRFDEDADFIPDLVTNDPEKTIEEIEKELEESKKASRTHQHKHGQTSRSTVRVKASRGTPLEPFAYRQLLVTVQDFIMRHKEYGDIDPTLKRKIDNGTLRKKDIDFYLRNTPGNLPTDAATFKLINEIFYQNEYITSFEQLDEYVEDKSAHYYAIRALFRGTEQSEQLIEKGGPKLYDVFMQLLENDLELKKKFDRIVRDYWEINYKLNKGSKQTVAEEKLEAAREQQVEKSRPMNARYLRFLWLSYFDGSVNAGAEAAAVARCMAYAGRDIANVEGSTLPEKAKVKIKPTKDDWELFTKVITNDVRGALVSAAQQGVTEEAIAEVKAGKKLTMEDLEARKTAITNEILYSQLNDPERFWELWNKYMLESQDEANIRFAQELVKTALGLDIEAGSEALSSKQEAKNTEIDDIIRNELKGKVRNKAAVMRNVRSILSNIQDKLSRRPAIATNNFLKHMDDLIDERLKLKDEAIHLEQKQGGTRLKDLAVLLEYEERLRKASKDITLGIYDDSRYTSRLRAERKTTDNLIRKLENAITSSEQIVGTGIKIGDETLHIDAERELPLTIKRLLETEIKRTAKSTTQLFTNDDERHIKMNYKNFITDHAEMLNALTQDQVNEIIEFYKTSGIVADTNRFRAYITIQQLLLGYIYDGNGKATCNFTLNSEQVEFIESRMEFMARTGATMIATWKTVLTKLKLQDEKTKAMLTIAGIELLPEDEKLLIDAINTGDIKQITSAKKEIYSKLVESYRGRKRTVFDRLLRFERMALLSGPGTWVRNEVTNRTLAPLNNLTAVLGNLFTKGEKQKARRDRLKQYTFTGTQIEQRYADWIENEIIKSGLLEAIGSASIKYNFRATTATVEDQLAKLVKDKIEAELFDKESGANPISRKMQEWITKAMSDDRAVNKSFKRYLGKMLTEDNLDISNGLTKELMDTIAEAYVFAAHDFMHKSNFWMKAENSFKTHLQKHFSPTAADGIYFMYKQVFPFAGASWNWFMEGLDYTPVGLIKGIANLIGLEAKVNNLEQARAKGEKVVSSRFAEYMAKRQLGKGVIGSAALIIGVLFAIAGKVELDKEDETYKLKFNAEDGPLYIDISNFFGTSGFIMGISIAQSFRDSGGKFDYNSFMRCWSTALNTMFLDSSFAELYNTFRYTESFGEYLAEMPIETAGMFVPNFVKTLGNTFKKYNVIYSPGFAGQLERFAVQSFAPFGYMRPYVVNPYTGEPEVINEGWFGINLINRYTPLRVKNYEFGDVERMAVSVGVKKGSLPGRYKIKDSTISLSSEETELLNQFYGKLNAKDLDDFMSNRTTYTVENEKGDREELTYRKMTDKQKAAVIERIMSNNSGMAKIYVLTSRKGYKYYANDSEYEKLRKAGVLNNVYRRVGKYEGFIKN